MPTGGGIDGACTRFSDYLFTGFGSVSGQVAPSFFAAPSSGTGSLRSARAACSPSRVAGEISEAIAGCGRGECKGAVIVLTMSAPTSSPMDRAASSTWASANRNLACQTGASTTNTSVLPEIFASRECAASEGDRQTRNRRSSASSHMARRIGSPAGSASSASSAGRGAGWGADERADDLDRESDITI